MWSPLVFSCITCILFLSIAAPLEPRFPDVGIMYTFREYNYEDSVEVTFMPYACCKETSTYPLRQLLD